MKTKKYQLPKGFVTKWVEALRSGIFKQTVGVLREKQNGNMCYCAIGLGYYCNGFELDMSTRVIIEGASIAGSNSNLILGGEIYAEIAALNDDKCKSFAQIADWIEANVELV